MTAPKVGDIVHWTGDYGPTWGLILEKGQKSKDHFAVLPLAGNFREEREEWRLNEWNKPCWEIVA